MKKLNIIFLGMIVLGMSVFAEVKNLTAEAGFNEVKLKWEAPEDNDVSKLEIFFKDKDSPLKRVKTVEKDAKEVVINKVRPFTETTFRIKLVFSNGEKSKGVDVVTAALSKKVTTDKIGGKEIFVYLPESGKKEDIKYPIIERATASETYSNSYMIVSSKGTTLIVDPYDSIYGIKPDAIVSTHNHPDHNDKLLYDKNKDSKFSLYTEDDFIIGDIHVYSVETSHNGDEKPYIMKNFVYIFEFDGIRVAHFGDIGQTKFTEEQLKKIGKIDIAFMQFENSYSDMTFDNGKGFNLMQEIKPQIIIPTHSGERQDIKMAELMGGTYEKVYSILPDIKGLLAGGKKKVVEVAYDGRP